MRHARPFPQPSRHRPAYPEEQRSDSSSHGTRCINVTCLVFSSTTAPPTPPTTDAPAPPAADLSSDPHAVPTRCQLSRPQRHRVGRIRLDRQNSHRQHRRKREERPSARHRVHHTRKKRRHHQPEVVPVRDFLESILSSFYRSLTLQRIPRSHLRSRRNQRLRILLARSSHTSPPRPSPPAARAASPPPGRTDIAPAASSAK